MVCAPESPTGSSIWFCLRSFSFCRDFAFYSRYQRNSMLDVLGSDFVRTAQAKGLRRSKALIKHALRTALIPMGTFFAYEFALIFIGSIFVGKDFQLARHGRMVRSIDPEK